MEQSNHCTRFNFNWLYGCRPSSLGHRYKIIGCLDSKIASLDYITPPSLPFSVGGLFILCFDLHFDLHFFNYIPLLCIILR